MYLNIYRKGLNTAKRDGIYAGLHIATPPLGLSLWLTALASASMLEIANYQIVSGIMVAIPCARLAPRPTHAHANGELPDARLDHNLK